MNKNTLLTLLLVASQIVTVFSLPVSCFAVGYAVLEQSAEGVGTAFSGGVTGWRWK